MSNGFQVMEGYTGCMGSGKTSRLVGALRHPHVQEDGVILFQPPKASRAGSKMAKARTNANHQAVPVTYPRQILRLVTPTLKHVGIEEIQFFGRTSAMAEEFKVVVQALRQNGHRVYWTGLPINFRGDPFEPVPWMMSKSDLLVPLQVQCARCRQIPAHYPQRLIFGHPAPRNHPLFVPDTERYRNQGISYEARCGGCYELPDRPNQHLAAILRALRSAKAKPRRHR